MNAGAGKSGRARILVVDDNPTIRSMLTDWLSAEYEVLSASDGMECLEILEKEHGNVDLVISDINMPRMNGFETIRQVRKRYPGVKTALITDYDVDSYIRMSLEQDITNIIVKTTPFNVEELFRTIEGLLFGRNIFGLNNYLKRGTRIHHQRIHGSHDLEKVRELLIEEIADTPLYSSKGNNIRMIFEEMASNAVYHAYGYDKFNVVHLKDDERVDVYYGKDDEKFGFSVVDYSGTLTKEIVLKRLLRAMSKESVFDFNGRGLFLTRNFSDRVIINIMPRRCTEVVILNYFNNFSMVNKPLYINQLDPATCGDPSLPAPETILSPADEDIESACGTPSAGERGGSGNATEE